jgi:hypothetical protein
VVTNPHILEAFERELQRSEILTLSEKYAQLDGMYILAFRLGHFAPERALEGLDETIQFAKALNSLVPGTSQQNRNDSR